MTERQLELQAQVQPQPISQTEAEESQSLSEPQFNPQPQAVPLSRSEALQLQLEEEVRPCRSRRLLLLLLVLGLVSGLVFYFQQYLSADGTWSKQADTAPLPCLSPACQEAAARLSVSVDPFAQPCDYFLFTCGSNGSSLPSRGRQRGKGLPQQPQDQGKRGVEADRQGRRRKERDTDRQTALLESLREILESEDQAGPGGSAVQKARAFYRSCMDTGHRETAGEQPFLRLIQELGGWPVSGEWNQTDFNSTLSRLMRDYATFPFFNLYVGKDPNDVARGEANRRYIQIDQPDFQFPIKWNSERQYSKANTQALRPFLALCEKYLKMLGAPSHSSNLHVGLFISLSSQLAVGAAPLPHRVVQGLLYQRMTIRELQTLAPAIDWLGCLQAALHPHPVSQLDHVLLHNLPYLIQMSRIIDVWLNKHEASDRGAVHTYMVLSLLHTVLPALDSRFAETKTNFSLALGQTEVVPCWKQCVLETERGFDMVLLNLLHERTSCKEAEEMALNIFSSLKSKLASLKWRDEKSRQLVLNKVRSLTPRLSTQRQILSDSELNQLLSKVTIREHDYFSNYLQSLSLQQKRRNKLFQTEEYDILSVTPIISGEELILPMGMFVPPLFHPSYPRAVNYGVLGSLIAKDMLHLLLPDIHSQSEMVQAVGECVWERYRSVIEAPGRVEAFSPAQQQELWMQYSALQMALQAYHQSLKQRPVDPSLSGLSQTHLFLASFTQINCYSDPYQLPFEHSFLVTVFCANSDLCPTTLACPNHPLQSLMKTC